MPLDIEKIHELASKSNSTNSELARRCGMSPQQWSNIIRGRADRQGVRLETAERVAKALGVKLGAIVTSENQRP
jgi:transcriptional regulator with XRE-family HTH domain